MELKGSQTEKNLQTAFAGESQARNKYSYYASKAKKDGYNQIAAIFEETAANEKDEMVGVVLNYDATNKIMTTNQTIYVNGSRHDLYYYYIYEGMTMTRMVEKAATPATPAITKFAYQSTLQYGYITLNIPLTDVEGNPLLSSKLYYQIMVEDKEGKVAPLTFTA